MHNKATMTRKLSSACIIVPLACLSFAMGSWATSAEEPEISQPVADGQFLFPRIKEFGKVVKLPNAVDQPRDGSKLCVDVTGGGAADSINPAIEKVARYINIFAGAGKKPANVRITIILHGKATLTALNDEAYAKKFQTDGNPNIPLFAKYKEAGVEILVCGQSLAHSGQSQDEVADEVGVAVSALTVNVNRQLDGYAVVQLR